MIENRPVEGFLKCSLTMIPKEAKDIFALRTSNDFQHHIHGWVHAGSFIFVDGQDRVISDGRLMVFLNEGSVDLRRCHVGERVWLEKLSSKKAPPIILEKKDAEAACLGFVSMIIPVPSPV